jgi:hypothetical protein
MILNTYAVLTVFVGLIRVLTALAVLGLGIAAWRGHTRSSVSRERLEDRFYLVHLLALLLLALNLVSWPLLYLLLQSYVPQWSGVMCIYGVMQVGVDSPGASRFLPGLLTLLQWSKPVLAFASGAWLALYLLNRRTRTGPLTPRLFLALVPLGVLAAGEVIAELAYVAIPKAEVFVPGGCCTEAVANRPDAWLLSADADGTRAWTWGGFYVANLALLAGLAAAFYRDGGPGSRGLCLLTLGGTAALILSGVFLIDIAAPRLLELPHHRCPYDLIPQAPESVLTVMLYLGGVFGLGWAGVVHWLGDTPETAPILPAVVRSVLGYSLWAYATALAMLSMELVLA